jgi:hypothetical protein
MKRLLLTTAFAAAALSLGACAAQHHAVTLGGPASRVVAFPGPPGS